MGLVLYRLCTRGIVVVVSLHTMVVTVNIVERSSFCGIIVIIVVFM